MAMQWRSFSAALTAAVLAGCMSTTQQSFLPDPGAGRITPDEFRSRASTFLAAECPRLMGSGNIALGEAGFRLTLAVDGSVREAILARPSPDERMNTLFGGLAAQLRFASATADGDYAPITAGYSCAPNAAVATLELNTTP
jgi:hypothetical protein